MASDVATQPEVYRIRDGVAKIRRHNGTVLVAPSDGRSLRISRVGEEMLPLLAGGAYFDTLEEHLRKRHPSALDISSKLWRFLEQLSNLGLLETSTATAPPSRVPARFPLFDLDPTARPVAALLRTVPAGVGLGLVLLALLLASLGVVRLVLQGDLPHPLRLFDNFAVEGLLIFVLLVVPLHEAAHALACRLAGARVGMAGIVLHSWVMPGPYVDTSHAYGIAERWKRFWIPAAGPTVDLISMGAAAWYLAQYAHSSDPTLPTAATLFLLSAAFLILDSNPLGPSDGSRMLEALLGDDLARRSALSLRQARLSGMREVTLYRIACSLYVQGLAVLAYFWWISAEAGGN